MPTGSLAKFALVTAVALIAAAPLRGLLAHDDNATGIYKVRHDGYHALGDAFKTIRDQVKSSSPNAAAIKSAAQVVNGTSVEQFKWFPEGSGPKPGVKTRAKAEIWSKPQDFEAAQKLFASAAAKLNTSAASGDVAAVRAQFGDVGKTCKNCHDTFRVPDEK
jgi:cytochrome c556